ncbi:MAG: Gfo/Idh/MocA family oxidoreductase [Verrucomicrobia bacterium]|nr:Gfo/Idh/MocA family oxidoreductase [Verrucomicrobiota bacterium]MBU4246877.1 Gfo/Idh/MocA family oxidoreductase [Verrucomicrobiota bacterium]MBU4290844.1 Gfo/Idh/MocA family oxidoreductase [Verrucomicrobiota bacterium]MBU4496580.1 Gfo/Idh/MocA family oxidoreductase [Verrucomicrobiota bacterium]MCG2680563.1 Gfo/Idh/MocA family oxidoreductase [Kiritimatiellia bacterium]
MSRFKQAWDIKVGVIGYGGAFNMGCAHLNEMKKAGMTPTAVAEIDAQRLKVAGRDFPGIQTYASVTEMLAKSDVNLLAIITPHNTHAGLAIQCLNAGRHVVCEKPLAITTAECDVMIAAAKKNKVVLSTYHNRHWDGHIMAAMRHIRAGEIGAVVRVDVRMSGWGKPGNWWRSSKTISGGLLYDWGVHLLEYTLQVVNDDIREVSGYLWSGVWANQTAWKKDTIEDDGLVVVRYAGGAWSTMAISSIDLRPPPSFFKVTGTKGTYIMEWGTGEIITHNGDKMVTVRVPNPPCEGWKLYQNVADHLTRGAKLIITPEWSRRPIHILDLAGRSARQGKAMQVKYK